MTFPQHQVHHGSLGEEAEPPTHRLERELLLRCARTVIDAETARRIRILLEQDIDWPYLIQTATKHQVAPLLGFNLCLMFAEACPIAVLDQLRSILRVNAARNACLTQELIKLLNLFEAHEIPVIPFKGPVLTSSVYGHVALRWFVDLDILVHKWDYHFRVRDLLVSHGWRLTADSGLERTFKDASDNIQVDVHSVLTHRQIPFALHFSHAWKRCVEIPICGKAVRTFGPSELLIVLCVQLARDMGAPRAPGLIKICDIAELIQSRHGIDWKWVIREAGRLGALRMLYLGLRTAVDVLDVDLPRNVWEKTQAFPQLPTLVTHVRERVLGGVDNTYSHPELLDGARWHSEIRERRRDRDRVIRGFLYGVTPNRYDFSYVRLPRALFSLYYLVRPIRLIDKYGRKLIRSIHRKAQA